MKKSSSSSRSRIITIIALVVLAAAAGGILYALTRDNAAEQTQQQPTVGSPVDVAQTPEFGACELVSVQDLRNVMQKGIVDVEEKGRSGVVSPNTNTADQCTFSFSTPQSPNNELRVDVYEVSADPENSADILDASWALDSDVDTPSYFKLEENKDGFVTAYRRVIVGAHNIQWTIQQPVDAQQFTYEDFRFILRELAEGADYTIIQQNALEINGLDEEA